VSSSLQHSTQSAGEDFASGAGVLRAERRHPGFDENRPVRAPALLPSYAALDLGTSNCRLLIARRVGEGFA
jgi:hypothetical protein